MRVRVRMRQVLSSRAEMFQTGFLERKSAVPIVIETYFYLHKGTDTVNKYYTWAVGIRRGNLATWCISG